MSLEEIKFRKEELVTDLSNDDLQKNIGKDFLKAAKAGVILASSGGEPPGNAYDFAMKLLKAMIPTPQLMGNTLSGIILEDKKIDSLTSKEEIERAALSGNLVRRNTTTAMKCTTPDCNNYHFLSSGLCAVHSGLNKDTTKTIFRTTKSTAIIEDLRPDLSEDDHYTVLGHLRSEMLSISQTFDASANAIAFLKAEAVAQLKAVAVDDIEKAQFLYQFNRLDANKNGKIDAADLIHHIESFDADFLKNLSPDETEKKVENWIKEVNDNEPSMTFLQYVSALLAYRKLSESNELTELNRYAFWDMRVVVLSIPSTLRKGWLLKRGYFLSKENLNPWALRYFESDGKKLHYYTTVPGTTVDMNGKTAEHKALKSIELLE